MGSFQILRALRGEKFQVGFALALLRGDPLQCAIHGAEDMGSAARSGGDFEPARRVAALPGGGLDERGVGIERGKDKVFIQVRRADLVWVAAGGWVPAALRHLLE